MNQPLRAMGMSDGSLTFNDALRLSHTANPGQTVTGAAELSNASWTKQYGNSDGASIQLPWDAALGLSLFNHKIEITYSKH